MTNEKDIEKHKLFSKLIESSKFQEDKLTTARVVANQDISKAANASKGLRRKK